MEFDLNKLPEGRPVISTPTSDELNQRIYESKQTLSDPPTKRGRKPKGTSVEAGKDASASFGPVLETALRIPFDIIADNTGCKEIRLSDAEAKGLGAQADIVLRQYAPQLQGPEAALTSLFLSLAMIGAGKYVAYRRYHLELELKKTPVTD